MNTRTIKFYGASDDLVELEGYISEEFDLPPEGWTGCLIDPDGNRVELSADYIREWELSVKVITGNVVEWDVRLTDRDGTEYDPAIEIDVPEGTTLYVPDPTEG